MSASSTNVVDTLSSRPTFTEHRIAREQGKLYARDYEGAGPAFVLMHGFPDNLHIYDDLIPYLATAGRRIVTFDFLGFGASDKPDGATYGFRQQLGDLEAVVEALDLDRIVPVGHDAAGPAAVNFAIEHPDQVASLCILNTFYAAAPTIRLPEMIELFATPSLKALAQAIAQSPEQVAWLLKFQQKQFKDALSDSQSAYFSSFLGPIVDNSFLGSVAKTVFDTCTEYITNCVHETLLLRIALEIELCNRTAASSARRTLLARPSANWRFTATTPG